MRQENAAARQENVAMHAETRRDFDQKFVAMRQENVAMHAETRQHFAEIDARFAGIDARFAGIDARFAGIDGRFDEIKRHFDVTAEQMRKHVMIVAEAVAHVDAKLDLHIEQTERGFAETHALIKFSHADLDRRVTKLEESSGSKKSR